MQLVSSSSGFQLAIVQLPGRLRRALKRFRKMTGLTAVASVTTSWPEAGTPVALSPPVHPRCAKKLASIPNAPCGEQWLIHVRSSRRSLRTHSHTCPIGLHCSCVPIHFGDQLVGVAKLVVDAGTLEPALKTALSVLKLIVSETCQESAVTVLSEEVRTLRQRMTKLQGLQETDRLHAKDPRARHPSSDAEAMDAAGAELVSRAVAQLQRHYQDPMLSLRSVAMSLGCNPKYLTSRFSRVVGEHMHIYLVTLRVSHACRLLVSTDQSVKAIAAASGFARCGGMWNGFRTHVGVSPKEYRRIFASP